MEKVKILGTGNFQEKNQDSYNYFIVKKNKDFFEWLADLLGEVFKTSEVDYDYVGKNYIKRKKNIKNFIDKHENYYGNDIEGRNNVRIDVFYGKDKAFIVLNMSLKIRKKFMKKLDEISVWVKTKTPSDPSVRKLIKK